MKTKEEIAQDAAHSIASIRRPSPHDEVEQRTYENEIAYHVTTAMNARPTPTANNGAAFLKVVREALEGAIPALEIRVAALDASLEIVERNKLGAHHVEESKVTLGAAVENLVNVRLALAAVNAHKP